MTALIVEDDTIQLNGIEAMLSESYPDIHFLKATNYTSAMELIHNHNIQFFLLDIELDKAITQKDGVALGEYIRSLPDHQTTPILFLTALPQEAIRAIHATNCYDYLVKPYDKEELIQSIHKLLNTTLVTEPAIEIRDNDGIFIRIPPMQIYYIHSERHKMYIYTSRHTYITNSLKLYELLSILPAYFQRCHKSYVVNTKYITSYDRVTYTIQLSMSPTPIIPVGRIYKISLEKEFCS